MKYVSIDVETTGLDTQNDQILSIGAVIEDTNNIRPIEDLPKIHIIVTRERISSGSIFALNMNRDLISLICKWNTTKGIIEKAKLQEDTGSVFVEEEFVVEELLNFLWKNGIYPERNKELTIKKFEDFPEYKYSVKGDLANTFGKTYFNIAGKNFNSFDIHFLERLPKWKMAIGKRARIIDPSVPFIDWNLDDSPPSLSLCKKRAGFLDDTISHNALEDAIDVLYVLRTLYTKEK